MDGEAKTSHTEEIRLPYLDLMYENLCDACEAREGSMSEEDHDRVLDIMDYERHKMRCIEDIKLRGVVLSVDDFSCDDEWMGCSNADKLRALVEHQRMLMAELRLVRLMVP